MSQLESTSRKVFLDVGGVIFYLQHHSSVTGIQRVLIELWKILNQSTRIELIPVSFVNDARHFVVVNSKEFNRIIQLLDLEGNETEIIESAQTLDATCRAKSGLRILGGETLIVAGPAWTDPWYFHGVNDLKGQKVRISTIIYDLIPILFSSFLQSTRIPFTRYVYQVIMLSDSIATISSHSRKDLDKFAIRNGLIAPSGPVTQLPGGFVEKTFSGSSLDGKISGAYILMVGTLEERKNHLLALRAYRKVIATLGIDKTPDLICVGRLGWNISDFLDEWSQEPLLQRKFKLFTDSQNDSNLANLYRYSLFTIYPSKYEGWGLPVTESLDFGIPVITTWASSLPEAGGEYATYVDPDDYHDLAEKMLLWIQHPEILAMEKSKLRNRPTTKWDHVGSILIDEIENANTAACKRFVPSLRTGIEYGFGSFPAINQVDNGDKYLQEIQILRSLPMTNSFSNVKDLVLGEFAINGPSGNRDHEGITYSSDSNQMLISLNFICDQSGDLNVLLATKVSHQNMRVAIEASGDNSHQTLSHGSVLSIRVKAKPNKEQQTIKMRFENLSKDNHEKIQIMFKSILILESSDRETELQVMNAQKSAKATAPAELIHNKVPVTHEELVARIVALEDSLSWKLTRPFRYVIRTSKRILFRK
jgi:glycosyltransferase involved in cell wall biosynthesis